VGNEYILNAAGSSSITSALYATAVDFISGKIVDFNTTIKGMSLDKHLPIGTSDAGSILSTSLASQVDFFMANVHPLVPVYVHTIDANDG
jgi:glucan 1,3-beta-glucosidase